MRQAVKDLLDISHFYGADAAFVLAGGGNTSVKDQGLLYIKGSGTTLGTITVDGFVRMKREALEMIWSNTYPANTEKREAAVLADLMAARVPEDQAKRPSVETMMHHMFPHTFVVHTHPALVNGVTCGKTGKAFFDKHFSKNAIWVPAIEPGYVMAKLMRETILAFQTKHGKAPQLAFLENHGLVVAADTIAEIKKLTNAVVKTISAAVKRPADLTASVFDRTRASQLAPAIRALAAQGASSIAVFRATKAFDNLLANKKSFACAAKFFSPDHIVYCGAAPLFVSAKKDVEAQYAEIQKAIASYQKTNGDKPRIIAVEKLGVFALGASKKAADTAMSLFMDHVVLAAAAQAFGGSKFLSPKLTAFIRSWEVESYRQKVSAGASGPKRLHEKVMLVTGAAQGFGKGISDALLQHGANVVVADLNDELARSVASDMSAEHGAGRAFAVKVNVGDEQSVEDMVINTVLEYGGVDALVSNAGVLKAGGLEEMDLKSFEFVTKINYSGYFLCTKYATRPMKIEHRFASNRFFDIIQISSKSGLSGSKNNFAYAGSKFGGIGLTQSFALELVGFNIKVNSVCPGNFFTGPLWSDPTRGLFVQYLKANKVPGAKTVEDVRRHYEKQVPMNRGCDPVDVARAILYIVEQEYETGQAIPVAGGQIMLT